MYKIQQQKQLLMTTIQVKLLDGTPQLTIRGFGWSSLSAHMPLLHPAHLDLGDATLLLSGVICTISTLLSIRQSENRNETTS